MLPRDVTQTPKLQVSCDCEESKVIRVNSISAAAACLLDQGVLNSLVSKERFTRRL